VRAVRALKDLEHEHAVGKVDDADYAVLSAELRAQAKAAMKELDADVAPYRAKAEAMLRKHLKERGLAEGVVVEADAEADASAEEKAPSAPAPARMACPSCGVSNESDASFCKKCGANLHPKEAADAQA
jgi:DNA-directed RNA polymerase subunit M/transcription elongation factor TFIIS